MTSEDHQNSGLAFPRHRPQLYATSPSSLARATLYCSYGRDFPTFLLLGAAVGVTIPFIRAPIVIRKSFHKPCGEETFEAIARALDLPTSMAPVFYQAPWHSRQFAVIVLDRSKIIGLVQVRPESDSYSYPRRQAWAFRYPSCYAEALIDGWHARLFEALPSLHRPFPFKPPALALIAEQASSVLSEILDSPSSRPEHWRPIHGDFTPWNLRLDRRGRVWLIDWERARWGPPAADPVRFAVAKGSLDSPQPDDIARFALGSIPYSSRDVGEAARFWLQDPIFAIDQNQSGVQGLRTGATADDRRGQVERAALRILAAEG